MDVRVLLATQGCQELRCELGRGWKGQWLLGSDSLSLDSAEIIPSNLQLPGLCFTKEGAFAVV